MTLANKILEIKLGFFNILSYLLEKTATLFFNYPNNPGMPLAEPYDLNRQAITKYVSNLPVHSSMVPPPAMPDTFLEAIFGNYPQMMTVTRTFYEHKLDGFYNFYIPNYQNIFFLPDWLSQWIQINFEITVDDTSLEIIRQGLFLGLLGFIILLDFRMKLFWFLTINPYTRPWIYIISLTDWVFEVVSGFVPVILGLDLSASVMLGLVGKITDSLNNLVFTMPFLPSEGVPGKMIIDDELIDVILFRYLPSLWYTHPIPDKLREYWYTERPEIFNFMKKNYGHLEIEFLPNRILKEMYENENIQKSLVDNIDTIDNISTKLISKISDYSFPINDFFCQQHINFHEYIFINIKEFIT